MAMISDILHFFNLSGKILRCEPFGNGHINWTYKVDVSSGDSYILQRINTFVFNDPVGLMRNIELLTEYLSDKVDDPREVLKLIKAKNGRTFVVNEEGQYWRCYEYVRNSVCYDSAPNLEMFTDSGRAFGLFQNRLADFPVEKLVETIPDFHNTVWRYQNLDAAIAADEYRRVRCVRDEIAFVEEYREFSSLFMDKIHSGEYKLRVTHNDTKINNVLFDKDTNKGLTVIDLDTTMPGLPANDFGDAIRYAANNGAEDDQNLDNVFLRMDLFEAYAKGFCGTCKEMLDRNELDACPEGAMMMTLENGVRFLTDYLQGDVYFHTAIPAHNLIRARTQFKLLQDMAKHRKEMHDIIDKIVD